jgi:hypothetical protein
VVQCRGAVADLAAQRRTVAGSRRSSGRDKGVGGAVPGHDSQACSGVDLPLTWTHAGVSALNAPAGGAGMGAVARDALERDGDLIEGAFGSRSRRGLARGGGGVQPSSEAESRSRVVRPLSETDPLSMG